MPCPHIRLCNTHAQSTEGEEDAALAQPHADLSTQEADTEMYSALAVVEDISSKHLDFVSFHNKRNNAEKI